jgi:hypothetical protein
MITDAMLKEAAAEAERFMLAHLPEIQEPHVFSKRFERKMQKLLARAKHPIRYQVVRYVAAVLLAIIMLFGTVLAVSPEVRATVFGWVRSTFYEYFQYSNDNMDNQVRDEYELAVIPDGYRLLSMVEMTDGKTYLFANDSGNILRFAYTYGEKHDSLFIKAEDYEQQVGYVNGILADIYLSTKEGETSVIAWQNRENNVLLRVYAIANRTELIEIAENVRKKE